VQVSLGSPEEKSNDAIRGRKTYKTILEAIDLLLDAGVQTQICITAMEHNWQAIDSQFRAFAERYDRDSPLRFHIGYGVCDYGRGETLDDKYDHYRGLQRASSLVQEVNQEENVITMQKIGCGYCEQLVVGDDGTIYPCHFLEGALGHVDDKPLAEWYSIIREQAALHQVHHVKGCSDCDIRNVCGGNCRIIDAKKTGSRLTTSCTKGDRARFFHKLATVV
jgi:radical SAM protein with 4Fe4S-binding SPASM domain